VSAAEAKGVGQKENAPSWWSLSSSVISPSL
jgi:hypothetical protein